MGKVSRRRMLTGTAAGAMAAAATTVGVSINER